MTTPKDRAQTSPGPSVDAGGSPVVDPSFNVMQLVEAANQRQNDLREETSKRYDAALAGLKEIAVLRARHTEETALLRAAHQAEMRHAEAARLDSIRDVDILARNTAADRANDAIAVLAATTATNQENLRTAMSNTATTIAKSNADTVGLISERIAALERSSYEGKGKQAVADPMMMELVAEMRSLSKNQQTGAGKSEGISASWAILLGAVGLLTGIAGAVVALLK